MYISPSIHIGTEFWTRSYLRMAVVKGEREERAPQTDSPLRSMSLTRWRGSVPPSGPAPDVTDRQTYRCR